ncbi:hypothetical protein HD806DRAFT_538183 [Xylariaceae sp. AK1471]|nr:hypothetical protein HD806DRAFT_538183 [Xylariaceae sp. AK1471]
MGTHLDMDPATLAGMPAGEPPPGVTSNLIDPVSRSWQVHLTIGLTIIPAVFLVALRIYAGLKLVRKLELDDFLDKPGGGVIGHHVWDVTVGRVLEYTWPATVDAVFLRISNTLIKVLLLLFYLRIFNPLTRIRWMIYIGLFLVVVFCLGSVIGTLAVCFPRPGVHYELFPSYKVPPECFTELPKIQTAGTIFSVVTDFYILFIPIHLLPMLKLSWRRKVAVASVFLIGLFACLAGVGNLTIRFARYLPKRNGDYTWNVIDTYITQLVETNVGLICACMPMATPIVAGPVRRLNAFFSSLFRKGEADTQRTKGRQDIPVPVCDSSQSGSGPAVPRKTLTSLSTWRWRAAGYRERDEESIMFDTLSTYTSLTTPRPLHSHGSSLSYHSGVDTDVASESQLHPR